MAGLIGSSALSALSQELFGGRSIADFGSQIPRADRDSSPQYPNGHSMAVARLRIAALARAEAAVTAASRERFEQEAREFAGAAALIESAASLRAGVDLLLAASLDLRCDLDCRGSWDSGSIGDIGASVATRAADIAAGDLDSLISLVPSWRLMDAELLPVHLHRFADPAVKGLAYTGKLDS